MQRIMEEVRDMSIPYSEVEIAICLARLRGLASYDPRTDTIGTEHTYEVTLFMKGGRSAKQTKAYKDYFERNYGKRYKVMWFDEIMRAQHSTALHTLWYAKLCDKNGDGVISRDEFDRIYGLMAIQWPGIAGKSYNDFVREADTDHSHTVDIGEFVAWIDAIQREEVRDMSIPYSEDEIATCLARLRALPSYDLNTDTIGTEHTKEVTAFMKGGRSPEQTKAYKDYFERNYGKRYKVMWFDEIMRAQHKTALHALWYAKLCDKNGDGVISRDEFDRIYGLMAIQWPGIAGRSYDDFVREADTDHSHTVDIGEFVSWIDALAG